MKFSEAVKLMTEGKDIRRKDEGERYSLLYGDMLAVTVDDILADDWEAIEPVGVDHD